MSEVLKKYVEAAQEKSVEGSIEVDHDAAVSYGESCGAYVQAWLWVPNYLAGLDPNTPSEELVNEELNLALSKTGEIGNEQRAEWAEKAVAAYCMAKEGCQDYYDERLAVFRDLITDMCHALMGNAADGEGSMAELKKTIDGSLLMAEIERNEEKNANA